MIPAFEVRQKDPNFKPRLGNLARPYLKDKVGAETLDSVPMCSIMGRGDPQCGRGGPKEEKACGG